jgi:glycosyltransferase involved in cell wall biosynthesis
MVKIIYDYQIFSRSKYGGVSRYLCEIATRIARTENFDVKVLAFAYISEYLRQNASEIVVGCPVPALPKTSKIISNFNFKFSREWLKKNPHDIVHETYYSQKTITPSRTKTVITVYDMIHEKLISLFPEGKNHPLIKAKHIAIKRADHIICISENTKKDLLEILNIDPKKISVIYLGCSLNCKKNKIGQPYYNFPFILYVGYRGRYKNFERLLRAYSSSKKLKKDIKLVCFGGGSFSKEEKKLIHELEISEDKVIQISGNDDILANLYNYASAFVYPSLYEGFGLPLLEAMSFRCPVVCSSISSIPEIAGDAAEFFNPYDIYSMSNALEKVVYSQDRTEMLIDLGLERIKNFSWEKCVQKTCLVYSSLK